MKKMVRTRQIDTFGIETFDNRDPYVLVVLSEKNRGRDVKAVATQTAESLHTKPHPLHSSPFDARRGAARGDGGVRCAEARWTAESSPGSLPSR